MADIAIKVHVPELYSGGEVAIPFPEWMDRAKAIDTLKDSARQSW
jgi:hypothetical protein